MENDEGIQMGIGILAVCPLLDPFMELRAEQAAKMLGFPCSQKIETAEEGDEYFVPYIRGQKGSRTFLLGDALTELAERQGLAKPQFPNRVATTREKAKAVMGKRVGKPASWHDEDRHLSNKDVTTVSSASKVSLPVIPTAVASCLQSGEFGVLIGALIHSNEPRTPNPAHRPVKQVSGVYEVWPTTVAANIANFVSLGDFMKNALPDDEWLFAVPPSGQGRPYDFIESLLAGNADVRWEVMTYREYLNAMLKAAEEDRRIVIASEESKQICSEMTPQQD